MGTGGRQETEAVHHGSAGDGVVSAWVAKAWSQGHAGMAVKGERVERTVGEEAIGHRLLMLVTVVAARARRDGRGMTSSLSGCLRSCASGTTGASSIASKLAMGNDAT